MKSAVEDIQPINLHSDLQQFINGLITDTSPRFSLIVEKSWAYKQTKKAIDEHLAADFAAIETETEKFEQCRQVHEFERGFNFEEFLQEPDCEDLERIKGLFDSWGGWEQTVQRHIQQYTNVGLLRADGKKLRDSLQSKVKKELANLRTHLFKIAERVYKGVWKSLDKIKEDLKKDMKNLDNYVQFVRGLKAAEDTLKECDE